VLVKSVGDDRDHPIVDEAGGGILNLAFFLGE
jgi:hypothetical protein